MGCCDHCKDAEGFFTERAARRELRAYRRRGATGTTSRMLDLLLRENVTGAALLDIGGGVGAIQHELFEAGIERAVHVDASRAYLNTSQMEAERHGHRSRVEYRYGDFAELAPEIPQADVVTLDRVVCCYPDMPLLIAASTAKASRLYALSYPRDRRAMRVMLSMANLWFRLRGSAFRTFVHAPRAVRAEIEQSGFELVALERMLLWRIELYRRIDSRE